LNQAQVNNVLWNITLRLTDLIKWTIFAVFHLLLLALFLLAAWIWQIHPQDIANWGSAVLQTSSAQVLVALLVFAGLSGMTLIRIYIRAWRKVYAHLSVEFLTIDLKP